ncbi:MAG: hypothetical protein CMN77_01320 [Spirochaetaceae bacterium]|nr:hypothetical protein [Spirochaetaceae bacterium]|tara:strand:+ start:59987 stop:60613 length:627 start_codon:yes stop_codon:yes gene_type:complete
MIQRFLKIHAAWLIVLILGVASLACSSTSTPRVLTPATDFLTDQLGKCTVVSVDLPPITLTPARTAAERQLIGEEKELVQDGWLVASSSALPAGTEELAGYSSEIRHEYRVLEFYSDIVQRYRNLGILGESYDGRVMRTPVAYRQDLSAESLQKAMTAADQTNRSRRAIYAYLARIQPREAEAFLRSFYYRTRSGEWIRNPVGAWVRK